MFKMCNIAAQICFYQTHNLYKCISVIHLLFLGHWVHCFASVKHANQFHTSNNKLISVILFLLYLLLINVNYS